MASSQLPHEIEFQSSLNAFIRSANLSPDEHTEFKYATLQDLHNAMHAIQHKQASSRKMLYMKRLSLFLETMEQYAKVIEVFTNAADMVAFIWGPMKFLLQVASNFSEAFNSLVDAYQQIGESMPQVLQYQDLFHESPHMRKVLSLMYADLLEFHREALKYFKGRVWKQLFQATWRGFNSKIACLVQNMQRHGNLLRSQATIVEFEEVQRIRTAIEEEFRNTREAEQLRRRGDVYRWLSTDGLEADQRRGVDARSQCPDSGSWLLKNSCFEKWFHRDFCETPLLWLCGIPGAGKTVLASLIIEEIRKLSSVTVAFFYCRSGNADRKTFVTVARGVLFQLLAQNEDLLPYLYEKKSNGGGAVLSDQHLARELLDTALESFEKTYLVIDGLDECSREERKQISSYFRNIVHSLPRVEADRIRCLFISQDDGYARKDLSMATKLKVTEKDNKGDIEAFTNVWESKIKERFPALDLGEHKVASLVTSKAQGMFLFAKLVMRHLYDQPSLKCLVYELDPDTFPEGLDDLYERILKRIFDNTAPARHESSRMLLGWLVCAKRPLKWREIQGAVSIDLEEGEVNLETGKFVDDSKDLCASLVEIGSDDSVELVHSTAKRFLVDKNYVKPSQVEYEMCSLCLGYLNILSDTTTKDNEEISAALLEGVYAFSDYAVAYWVSHFEGAIPGPEDRLHLEELIENLEVFLEMHWEEPSTNLPVSATMHEKLQPFKSQGFYKNLAQAVVSSKKQLGVHGKGPSDDVCLDLYTIMLRWREALEYSGPILTQTERTKLKEYYGPNWFKCRRMNCHYFHRGFNFQRQRDEHINRHEGAFSCTFEGCPRAMLGFPTLKELEKHLADEHDIDTAGDLDFPETPKRKKEQRGDIPCPQCGKMFTQTYNMKHHLRSHSSEKKFKCEWPECGKGFSKKSDRDRHAKIHSGEKEHECWGSLQTGESWGCRKKFSRADKLRQHHESDTGRRCLKPLLDEEARQQAEAEARAQAEAEAREKAEAEAREQERIQAEAREQERVQAEAREQERIRAEEAAKEMARVKAEEEAALERAKQEETEEARNQARKYAERMAREWERIQAEEETRKQAQKEAEERSGSHTPVHIPAITVEPSPRPDGPAPLPPFSTLVQSASEQESDG